MIYFIFLYKKRMCLSVCFPFKIIIINNHFWYCADHIINQKWTLQGTWSWSDMDLSESCVRAHPFAVRWLLTVLISGI